MFELTLILLALVGSLSLFFAVLAMIVDYILPSVSRKPWRPQATYRRR